MPEEIMELIPDPKRMVEGLRDTGYQFKTAIADIVDNSLAAEATMVEIIPQVDFRGQIVLYIVDNGIGMNKKELINAMKYGSDARESAASLGKFGLGLKTASTAFCRQLSVISKKQDSDELVKATWDIDHVGGENKWQLKLGEPDQDEFRLFKTRNRDGHGTIVVWKKIDRLLKNQHIITLPQKQKALKNISSNLADHLGMVFQRFLDEDDDRESYCRMKIGDVEIVAWDPFCRGESEMVLCESRSIEMGDGESAEFEMKAYVLPRREEFSSPEAAKIAKIGNNQQGVYVYRENRLIHGPTWLDLFSKEPHLSLLRVEFDFDYRLDAAFQIDIKKSQIILDDILRDCLIDFLNGPRRAADEAYRAGRKSVAADASKTAHDGANRVISEKENELSVPKIIGINQETGEVQLQNRDGFYQCRLRLSTASKPSEVHVQPVPSIDDGILWEPCLIDGHHGVRINIGHPYYDKVYLPNLSNGVTIQGMDSLLWGLAIAEMNCLSDATSRHFKEMRYEVSRNLRMLVEDMPEAKVEQP